MTSGQLRSRRLSIEASRAAGAATDPVIHDSWNRCRPLIDEHRSSAPVDAEPDEVQQRWEASPIRRSGIGVDDQLGRAAEASGLIAAITDDDGRILWTAGSRTMRAVAERVGFVPGGRWDEPSAGTNALGLALLTGRPSTVFSAEHWCEAVHNWVCWSVPVTAPDGHRVGVLDLSGRWDNHSPMAELAVTALGRLVEDHLPDDLPVQRDRTLEMRLLGHPTVTVDGHPVALSPRQAELLAVLAIEGPCTLEQLHDHVHGDRAVSTATTKAEMSHLRRILGGGIESRPYRLTVRVRVDALEVRHKLQGGDVSGAVAAYTGQLMPNSESPFAIGHRHLIDATLRRSLLDAGNAAQLLRFADVHRYDEAVLERAIDVSGREEPLRYEAEARLQLARRE